MKRQEAEKLVGSKFSAWTPVYGTYVGTLLEVLPTRPWRAKIRIESLLEFPAQGMNYPGGQWHTRKPMEEGKILEVGGINARPFESPFLPYRQSVVNAYRRDVEKFTAWKLDKETNGDYKHDLWWINKMLESLKELEDSYGKE